MSRSEGTVPVAFVDANVILCYLLGEPPAQAQQAAQLFNEAAGGALRLRLTSVILAEVVWVLDSHYRVARADIASALVSLCTAEGVDVESKPDLMLALTIYEQRNVDFADALLAAHCLTEGPATVYSFDRHFARVPGLDWRVPGAQDLY